MNKNRLIKHIVVMGVSGAGKTTVGRLLSVRLGGEFLDGDDFHSVQSIEKMRSGQSLDDIDRWTWLDRLRAAMEISCDRPLIIACSALKAIYRQRLNHDLYTLVHLTGEPDMIKARLRNRQGHFMPLELFENQISILEPTLNAIVVDIGPSPEEIVESIVAKLNE